MMSFCGNPFENDFQNSSECKLLFSSGYSENPGTGLKSNKTVTSQAKLSEQTEIEGWRRAVREDKKAIKQLQLLTGDVADLLYRGKNLDELIENCYFPIVQFDTKGDLISFTAYDSYPDLPFAPFWMEWLKVKYKINGICPGNVFFVHYMVWQPEHEDIFFPLLLQTSFTEFLYLKYIIILQPPKTNFPNFYRKFFFPVFPIGLEEFETSSIQLLHLCLRTVVINPLNVRTAFASEFAGITSVLERNLKKSKDVNTSSFWDLVNFLYQKDKKTLICEFDGKLAGIMILNLKTDLDRLNEVFELGPFNGLRKTHLGSENVSETEVCERPSKTCHGSHSLNMSSKLVIPTMNWEISYSTVQKKESASTHTSSCESPMTTSFSQFSFSQLSSLIEAQSSNETSHALSQGKSDVIPKLAGDVNLLIRTAGNKMTHFFPPKYSGQSNAFIIDFFAIDWSKIDEKLSFFDFLETAFRLVPDREYCILLIPTNFINCPILDLFVRVTPRLLSSFKQELYLCHKNSLSVVSMSVRSAKKEDLLDICNFLKHVDEGDTVYNDILKCFEDDNGLKSFVFTFEDTIIGVSLINSQDCLENFRSYFEVADSACTRFNLSETSLAIKHLVINPKYNNHARFFVRDIMRLIDVTSAYYVNNKSFKNQNNLVTVLEEFAQVKPKKKIELNDPSLYSEQEFCKNPFSLFILHPQLCGFRKIQLNIVIVVVGASRTALSFLESLIFGPASCFYKFNNIICVSPRGLEVDDVEENVKNLMFPSTDNFSGSYLSMLSLNTYVSCIYGHMTDINRSEKYIVVNNKTNVKYDYLVLTCGLQYITPVPDARAEVPKNRCKSPLSRFFNQLEKKKNQRVPSQLHNMFIINTVKDAQVALQTVQFLMQKITKDGKKIIVYGHDLNVFLTINTLLKMGIPGEFIAFVEPFPSETKNVTLFNNCCVDKVVIKSVKDCNVNYYTEYFLHDWAVSPENYITSIKFHSKRKQIIIPCLAFFPFLEKLVSEVTYNACRNAGLVYDGKLVINHNFRTNDQYIYAAGPFTKYSRRYYAHDNDHQYFNSREVGQKLADIIRGEMDPTTKDKATDTFGYTELVPQLVAPVFFHCHLPGDLNLFNLRKPGKEIDLETAYNLEDYGEVITTGDCNISHNSGYFRLHLNPEGFVESITCLTKDKIDYLNLVCLYGLHESILNHLLLRYDLNLIPDLFEYFRQPWAHAIYHDSFQRLREINYEAFSQNITDSKTFYERVVEELQANNWERLQDIAMQELEVEYSFSNVQNDIKDNLMRFLEHFKEDLPFYASYTNTKNFRRRRKF